MAEGFDFQVRGDLCADFCNLRQAQFPCQHHPLRTQIVPSLGTGIVGNGLLGGHMALAMGGVFSGKSECSQVCDYQRVHAGIIQLL